MNDWDIAVIAMCMLFFFVIFLLLWLSKDQARLNGKVEAEREEIQQIRDECYALRERLKEAEKNMGAER